MMALLKESGEKVLKTVCRVHLGKGLLFTFFFFYYCFFIMIIETWVLKVKKLKFKGALQKNLAY